MLETHLQDVNVSAGGSRHNATEPSSLKGLDFALLEQEKAKAGLLSTNDVDELERAFAESSASRDSEQVAPRKRTREDLIRELIQKRAETEGQSQDTNKMDALLEGAKQRSKFKPIGFTSIGKRKKDETDKKKKKRKVDTEKNSQAKHQAAFMSDTKIIPRQHQPPVDEGFDDNFDIFAGAGEYTGVDIDENEEATISPHKIEEPASLPQRWIAMDDSEQLLQAKPEVSPIPVPEDTKIASEQDQEVAMRLAPLETSAIPSIKELLEMHDAADKYDKKMKQKEKKQRKRGGNKGKASDDE